MDLCDPARFGVVLRRRHRLLRHRDADLALSRRGTFQCRRHHRIGERELRFGRDRQRRACGFGYGVGGLRSGLGRMGDGAQDDRGVDLRGGGRRRAPRSLGGRHRTGAATQHGVSPHGGRHDRCGRRYDGRLRIHAARSEGRRCGYVRDRAARVHGCRRVGDGDLYEQHGRCLCV